MSRQGGTRRRATVLLLAAVTLVFGVLFGPAVFAQQTTSSAPSPETVEETPGFTSGSEVGESTAPGDSEYGDTGDSDQVESTDSTAPATGEEALPTGEATVTIPEEPGFLSMQTTATELNFDGQIMTAGENFRQTMTIRVESSGNWALWLNKAVEMRGEQTGWVLPHGCFRISFIAEQDGVYTSGYPPNAGGTLIYSGTGNPEVPTYIHITCDLDVPWEFEEDVYRGALGFSLSPQ